MVKGGYQIINLENKDLTTGVGMQYSKLYEKIEGTRKPILLSGIQIDGTEYHDCFVEPIVDGTNYNVTAYGKTITISDLDIVTVLEPTVDEGTEPEETI